MQAPDRAGACVQTFAGAPPAPPDAGSYRLLLGLFPGLYPSWRRRGAGAFVNAPSAAVLNQSSCPDGKRPQAISIYYVQARKQL